jgi:transcription-repair coupling factor (superfamily II helicase)
MEIESFSSHSVENFLHTLKAPENNCYIYTRYAPMIQEFLSKNKLSHIPIIEVKNHLLSSFHYKHHYCIADDVIQKIFIKRRLKKKLSADIDLLLKIRTGDFVVHIDHGI